MLLKYVLNLCALIGTSGASTDAHLFTHLGVLLSMKWTYTSISSLKMRVVSLECINSLQLTIACGFASSSTSVAHRQCPKHTSCAVCFRFVRGQNCWENVQPSISQCVFVYYPLDFPGSVVEGEKVEHQLSTLGQLIECNTQFVRTALTQSQWLFSSSTKYLPVN